MPSSINKKNNGGTLVISETASPALAALSAATQLRERIRRTHFDAISGGSLGRGFASFAHTPGMTDFALAMRNQLLPHFGAADDARVIPAQTQRQELTRKTAVVMISRLLGAFGAKDDGDLLDGMIALIEGDELARAYGD
jgi:hypothetical protein